MCDNTGSALMLFALKLNGKYVCVRVHTYICMSVVVCYCWHHNGVALMLVLALNVMMTLTKTLPPDDDSNAASNDDFNGESDFINVF